MHSQVKSQVNSQVKRQAKGQVKRQAKGEVKRQAKGHKVLGKKPDRDTKTCGASTTIELLIITTMLNIVTTCSSFDQRYHSNNTLLPN